MSRSPIAIARTALGIGQKALPSYSSKYSPKRYTQAQLFACLALMQFLKTDYRGLVQFLRDWAELRQALGLTRSPHYSTLCYAHQRLMQPAQFEALLHAVWERARELGWSSERPTGLVDATGLEARHVSRHYVWRAGYRRFARRRWPKLTLVGDAQTHLIGAAVITWGPSQDSAEFPSALRQSARQVHWDRIIADAAYDAEHNHRLCREELKIRSTVIPLNKRRGRRWPKEPYRRQMKRRFFRRIYHQRWQIESLISRLKRRLGSALRSRIWQTQKQECRLRVLTHNLMLLGYAA